MTENEIELFAIEQFEQLGYQYVYGPSIAPDAAQPERSRWDEVLLSGRLMQALRRINPDLPLPVLHSALKEVERLHSPDLLASNEAFHRLLTEGVKVSTHKDGSERGDIVWLVDFNTPSDDKNSPPDFKKQNNEFLVINQLTVIENNINKRPDLVLYVNGMPLVVIELKNAADENATVKSAFKQLETYKHTISSLFTYNALLVISDGLEAKAGSLSAGLSRFMAWKTADGKTEASNLISQLATLINGMLNRATLLDLVRHFIVYEKTRKEDAATGLISITTVKKIAAYHQYYAVNAAVESTLRAAGEAIAETPEAYHLPSVKNQPRGDRKAGVVWHTQGSVSRSRWCFIPARLYWRWITPRCW